MAHLTLAHLVAEPTPPPPEGGDCRCNGGLGRGTFEKLGSDLESLIQIPDKEYSDVTMVVDGKRVPMHRCILAVRCPVFRNFFAEMDTDGRSAPELELHSLTKQGRIGYEAFMTVMGYAYGAKLRPLTSVVVECWDSSCVHVTCRPAIDYVLELFCASLLFDILELKTVAEQHLVDHLDTFQVDDVVHVYKSACINEASQLQSVCLNAIAASNLDSLTLEKEIFGAALEQVRAMRAELGRDVLYLDPIQEGQCKQIHRALDLDDIELVQLLLDEKKLDLDGAHALHYAAAYCDPKTMAELLDLGLADTNLRNERGMTVLHVASWRREPQAIANLLEKGARVKDRTLDDQTALDISRRLAKKSDVEREEDQKDRLCIEILEQAEKNHAATTTQSAAEMLTVPSTESELVSMLLYLENRVSLARLLFPCETNLVMGISNVDQYPGATGAETGFPRVGIASQQRRPIVDLNEEPTKRLAGLVGVAISDESKENRLESLRQRCEALRKAVQTGRRFFPCYSAVIDKYVIDDDWIDLSDKADTEEQLLKKRRYVELKGILQDAFLKDKADMEKKTDKQMDKQRKSRRLDVPLSSSSSTSSSRGTSGSLITKL